MSKKELIPILRFSEFRDEMSWTVGTLGRPDLSCFIKQRVRLEELNIESYVSTENLLPNYAGVSRSSKLPPSGSFTHYKRDDILISNIRPYLKKVWSADREGAASNDVIVIRSGKSLSPKYLLYIVKNDYFINYVMNGTKGVKMPRGDLDSIKKYLVPYPGDLEQQKIADCLSSIDELITAQNQKLEALNAHKKGLMQKLFPAQGETMPKLRFGGFVGEWRGYSFGKILKVVSGKGFKAAEYSKYGVRLLQIENVGYGITKWNENTIFLPETYCTEYSDLALKSGDVVLALNRPVTNGELKIAKLSRDDEPSILYQRVGKVELLDENMNFDFIFHFCRNFIKGFVDTQSIGSDQPFISLRDLYSQDVLLPDPEEQQKIAECLSSIDELIKAQIKKIDSLSVHKKGLMQQLFPAVEEGFA